MLKSYCSADMNANQTTTISEKIFANSKIRLEPRSVRQMTDAFANSVMLLLLAAQIYVI
jgi:hypothetical protein